MLRSKRIDSGQLQYYVSGFLTMQLEIQNFFSELGLGGPRYQTEVFPTNGTSKFLVSFLSDYELFKIIAQGKDVFASVVEYTVRNPVRVRKS